MKAAIAGLFIGIGMLILVTSSLIIAASCDPRAGDKSVLIQMHDFGIFGIIVAIITIIFGIILIVVAKRQ